MAVVEQSLGSREGGSRGSDIGDIAKAEEAGAMSH